MASAEKSITRREFVTVVTEGVVVLNLSMDEATALKRVLQRVGGLSKARAAINEISDALGEIVGDVEDSVITARGEVMLYDPADAPEDD